MEILINPMGIMPCVCDDEGGSGNSCWCYGVLEDVICYSCGCYGMLE